MRSTSSSSFFKFLTYAVPLVLLISVSLWAGFSIESEIKVKETEATKNIRPREGNLNEDQIVDTMHSMANTLIIPGDGMIDEEIPITEEYIDYMIVQINRQISNGKLKSKLLSILNLWQKRDFSQAVEDHNYLWNLQDGVIGKAVDLRAQYKTK